MGAVIILYGCGATERRPTDIAIKDGHTKHSVLDVPSYIHQNWKHMPIRGRTDYRFAYIDETLAIQARGAGGASGLIRRITTSHRDCQHLTWTWRVDQVQQLARLSDKNRDDVAASIFILFGDPGFLTNPERVPTIRYVWTSKAHSVGDVISNPYFPRAVQNIVLRTGTENLSNWIEERRNFVEDFKRVFGYDLENEIGAIAIFTDNDQTKEPVLSYYKKIDLECD